MIPKININLRSINDTEEITKPSKIYMMNINHQNIRGYIDNIESVKQTVYKILNTERYNYYIYSKNYGVELSDLLGEPISYVCPEIERRITEALMIDDRITSVDSFLFNKIGNSVLHVTFKVKTIFGDFISEKDVSI